MFNSEGSPRKGPTRRQDLSYGFEGQLQNAAGSKG